MSNRDNIEITLITENDRERMEQVAQMETDVFPDPWSYHEVRSTVRQKHTFCAAAMEGDTLLGYFLCYYVLDECEIARIYKTSHWKASVCDVIMYLNIERAGK